MLVVLGEVVGDAGEARVHVGAAELFGGDFLAGRRLHERRAAEKDRAGAVDDDGFVRHRRHVGAAGRARAHDHGDLRNALGRHARLVEEDPAEVLAIGKDLGLQRQERAARIDEVDARQPVLERDLLRAEVLLHGHRVVGAALDRRVVGDDQHFAARDAADAGHEAGGRRLVVVHVERRQRRQLEKRRPGIEQPVDPLAHRQLALLAVALAGISRRRPRAPRPGARAARATSCCMRSRLALKVGVGRDRRASRGRHHPQQSVLKPQPGSARRRASGTSSSPQRSQSILSSRRDGGRSRGRTATRDSLDGLSSCRPSGLPCRRLEDCAKRAQ